MAKRKNNPMVAFLDTRIEQKEKQLIEHNGLVPHDFDMLVRYHELRKWYDDKPEEGTK